MKKWKNPLAAMSVLSAILAFLAWPFVAKFGGSAETVSTLILLSYAFLELGFMLAHDPPPGFDASSRIFLVACCAQVVLLPVAQAHQCKWIDGPVWDCVISTHLVWAFVAQCVTAIYLFLHDDRHLLRPSTG
jgi:hypothetical protein